MPFCSFEIFKCDSYLGLQFFPRKKGKVYLAMPLSHSGVTVLDRHILWRKERGLLCLQVLSGQVTFMDLSEVCMGKSFAACKSSFRKKKDHLFTFL